VHLRHHERRGVFWKERGRNHQLVVERGGNLVGVGGGGPELVPYPNIRHLPAFTTSQPDLQREVRLRGTPVAKHPHATNLEEEAAGHEVGGSQDAGYHVVVCRVPLFRNPHRLNELHQVRLVLVRPEEVQGGPVVSLALRIHLHVLRVQVDASAAPEGVVAGLQPFKRLLIPPRLKAHVGVYDEQMLPAGHRGGDVAGWPYPSSPVDGPEHDVLIVQLKGLVGAIIQNYHFRKVASRLPDGANRGVRFLLVVPAGDADGDHALAVEFFTITPPMNAVNAGGMHSFNPSQLIQSMP